MAEFEQDPSANTGRFRAFVERRDEDASRARRPAVPPVALIVGVVAVIVVVLIIVAVA
jgi:hypothetical protein